MASPLRRFGRWSTCHARLAWTACTPSATWITTASRRVLEKGGFVLDQILLRYYPFPNLHPIDLFDVCAYVRDADLL